MAIGKVSVEVSPTALIDLAWEALRRARTFLPLTEAFGLGLGLLKSTSKWVLA